MNIKRLALLAITTLWVGLAQAGGHLMVENAWIREAPPGASALAGYMTLYNHSDQARVLDGASSSAFGNVMLHRTVIEEGMAKMVPQPGITIPAGESLSFKPNDYHMMLMKPKRLLKAGDQVDVTLSFKNGEALSVTYEVRGDMGSMDHGNMSH